MANIPITIPLLNPVRFFREDVGDFFYNFQKEWEYKANYCQKYQFGDTPVIQILTPFYQDYQSPDNEMDLVNSLGVVVSTHTFECLMAAYGGFLIVMAAPIESTLTEGIYYYRARLRGNSGPINFWSEPMYLKATHDDTVLIEYGHDLNDFDCIFKGTNETPPVPLFQIRVEGGLKQDGFVPGGKYTLFQDQDLSPVMLQGVPVNVYRFTFGNNRGIPNYMADKINRLFSLSNTFIDGLAYMRNEGAKLEPIERDPLYPLCSWVMDLALKENKYSDEYDPTDIPNYNYETNYSYEYS